MPKVILICGTLCSGKSTLAGRLAAREGAVILSVDRVTKLFGDDLGDRHDAVAARVQGYLRDRAVELVRLGVSVILDWGFWRASDRAEISRYLDENGVPFEWHYMDVDRERLSRNIAARNAHPGPSDYIVDAGLMDKCLSAFEPPEPGKMDFAHTSAFC